MSSEMVSSERIPLIMRPLRRVFRDLAYGRLHLSMGNGAHMSLGEETSGGVEASLHIQNPFKALWKIMLRGHVGFAEGYIDGDWSTPDIRKLLELLSFNEVDCADHTQGSIWARFMDRIHHHRNRNDLKGSRRNIEYHYDLGNEFYRLWLDSTMSYSSAFFDNGIKELSHAQTRKYERMLEQLGARAGDHILEIGCGWGGFAEVAARQGIRVTGLTLSTQQLAFAKRRLQEQGLDHMVDLRLLDYRLVEGRFDHVVSIEMFEAVGQEYWSSYFDKLSKVLKPGGKAALQIITIDEKRFEDYQRNPDFIQLYIFPGGMLPTKTHLQDLGRDHGLNVESLQGFGLDYADTLMHWYERFTGVEKDVRALGFDERFMRIWRYYLAYCEAGFRTHRVDVVHLTLSLNEA